MSTKASPAPVVYQVDEERLMSIHETAAKMGCSQQLVRDLIHYGYLRALRFGRNQKVIYSTFVSFLHEHDGQDVIQLVSGRKEAEIGA